MGIGYRAGSAMSAWQEHKAKMSESKAKLRLAGLRQMGMGQSPFTGEYFDAVQCDGCGGWSVKSRVGECDYCGRPQQRKKG